MTRPAPPGPRRVWSLRRAPAGVTALVVGAVAAAVLAETVAGHLDRSPTPCAAWLAERLGEPPVSTAPLLTVLGASALLGLWLLGQAVTPGARRRLATRPVARGVHGELDRSAAVRTLRDAALAVPGVVEARLAVRRRRVTARATTGFGSPKAVRTQVTRTLEAACATLGLRRPPRVTVRLERGPHWRPPASTQPGEPSPTVTASVGPPGAPGGSEPGEPARDGVPGARTGPAGHPRRGLRLANRVLLTLAGAALLACAAWLTLAAGARAELPWSVPGWWPGAVPGQSLLGDAPADGWRRVAAPAAWPVLSVVVPAAVLALALGWLVAQAGPRPRRQVRLPDGRMRLGARTFAAAVADDVEGVPGVRRARVSVHGRGRQVWLRLSVTLAPGARPATVLHAVEHGALRRARASTGFTGLRATVRLRVPPHRASRVAAERSVTVRPRPDAGGGTDEGPSAGVRAAERATDAPAARDVSAPNRATTELTLTKRQ
ncbi:hypothetical protein JJV70_12520 [Streptomyces sp. JJ66]|uniref:DUF6286 domain-containing protein n=1 Tax=Streptomyces sp. JJ66 TaxID=2803843 RepID=UPI001C58B03C|nr:DUF6286 domain-containing protein [Streptomyces sp. JJ66]MBW1602918.1 hypothetical protein [Streptomyces sp. JJ66]